MAYQLVKDFRYGMDRRRPRAMGVPGTLWTGKNVHISRGGDLERAKKFVDTYTLPVGSFGLSNLNGQLWVFGSADISAAMPPEVQYQRLTAASAAMAEVLAVSVIAGAFYVVARYDDGNVHHFYGGARVTDWDAKADANTSASALTSYFARLIGAEAAVDAISSGSSVILTAATPGTAFSVSASAVNGSGVDNQTATVTTLQTNVAAVPATRAQISFVVKVGTTLDPLAGVTLPWVSVGNTVPNGGLQITERALVATESATDTAAALAVQINNKTYETGYSAEVSGRTVTVYAPDTIIAGGLNIFFENTVMFETAPAASLTPAIAEVAAVAQVSKVTFGGAFEATDTFSIVVGSTTYKATGRAAGVGTYAYVYKNRVFCPAAQSILYSELNDPDDFSATTPAATAAGFISLSNDSEGADRLTSVAPYQNNLAFFSERQVRIYLVTTDATETVFQQPLENTGTYAPRSVTTYGNIDVFYLDRTGVRSIQARDVSNAAFVSDSGSPIDTFVQAWVDSVGEVVASRAVGVIEPRDGRFWLAIGERIYVFSYFPNPQKISAWTYYEPGFSVSDFTRVGNRLYARSADKIYLYGGRDGATYPAAGETEAVVELPFLAAETPATFKKWKSFDVVCENTWNVEILPEPRDETIAVQGGIVTGTTTDCGTLGLVGRAPSFAMRLTCSAKGAASLSSLMFHYEVEKNE